MRRSYRVLFELDEDGKFTVTVPELPRCISFGNTRDEALENIKEAIEAYMRVFRNTMNLSLLQYARKS